MPHHEEASVAINAHQLHKGEVMTLRVALTSWLGDIRTPDSLGRDRHGRAMRKLYLDNGERILKMMLE